MSCAGRSLASARMDLHSYAGQMRIPAGLLCAVGMVAGRKQLPPMSPLFPALLIPIMYAILLMAVSASAMGAAGRKCIRRERSVWCCIWWGSSSSISIQTEVPIYSFSFHAADHCVPDLRHAGNAGAEPLQSEQLGQRTIRCAEGDALEKSRADVRHDGDYPAGGLAACGDQGDYWRGNGSRQGC